MIHMHLSVRAKQVAGVTSLVGVVVVTLSALHLATLVRVALGENQARGELLANAVFHRAHEVVAGAGADPSLALQDDRGVRAILESSVYSPNVTYAAIADNMGTAFAHSDPLAVGKPMLFHTELRTLLDRTTIGQLRALYEDGGGLFEVRTPLLIEGRAFGSIRIGVSMMLVRRDLMRELRPSLVTALIALVVAALLAIVLARSLLRPVHVIRSGLSRLGQGEFGVTVDLPQRDEFGELGQFFNTVSAQVSADRSQLAGQKATLESLMERFDEAVGFFGPDGEVLFANPGMLASLPEAPADSTVGPQLLPGHPYREIVDRCLASRLAQGPVAIRVPVVGPLESDTAGRPAQERFVTADPIEGAAGSDRPGGVMLVARNLAGLTEVQSTININQRLTALGRLTSGVAHELKNPLNAMGIHLELIRQRLETDRGEGGAAGALAINEHLSLISSSLRRLDEVVQVFLRFTRPAELRFEPLSVAGVIDQIRPIIEAEAGTRGVTVEIDCPPEVPAIRADGMMLGQAFLNLALNACQSMPGGGRLRITAAAAPGHYVEVRFEDTGVGIAPENLDKVFNLYFTTREGGSGIGLSMVYRTVQLHDGEIEVLSSVGHGACFRVLLPQAQAGRDKE
jgi:signal transduction histidine kinase/HAMP domain-containing protein